METQGCRCRDPTVDRWGLLLHGLGAIVCACLFMLGFLMFKLPFGNQDAYTTGQWLSCVSQGTTIMLVTLAGFVDSIYATRCISYNFGFLSHVCGRTFFYVFMGFYTLPVTQTLHELSQHGYGQDSVSATFALAGVVLTFVTGALHCCLLMRGQLAGDRAQLSPAPAPQRVGAART
mmetsp:Transcript_15086/g.35329  ORF Transcript_15086/g.35329 Transcript_15086/m.35329 type:complete len:176 (+) Transcript_15086:92-619(+)